MTACSSVYLTLRLGILVYVYIYCANYIIYLKYSFKVTICYWLRRNYFLLLHTYIVIGSVGIYIFKKKRYIPVKYAVIIVLCCLFVMRELSAHVCLLSILSRLLIYIRAP